MTLDETRVASPLMIAAVPLADMTWVLFVWSWLFTLHGPIATTFGASIIGLAISLALICGAARLRLRDVGLTRNGLLGGLGVAVIAWLVVQLVLVAATIVAGKPLALTPHLGRHASELVTQQVAGNALAEEVVFRGFLLVQLVLLARRWLPRQTAVLLGLVASQTIFALTHLPQRWIAMDIHGMALVQNLVLTAAWGMVYAVTYLRTGMLGMAVAFHALSNEPLELVDSPLDQSLVYIGVLAVLLLAWPRLSRMSGRHADVPR